MAKKASAVNPEFKPRDNKNRFMKRADKALYKAKKSGRDKFAID